MTEKIIKIKDYEWTNPKYGQVIREYKIGNKILCRITRKGEGYRSSGEYCVDAPKAGFAIYSDSFKQAEKDAEKWIGWGKQWDNLISNVMKGYDKRRKQLKRK